MIMVDSCCGLHCTSCQWKESHGCGGCIETKGHPFHGECTIAICCQNKGFNHCGECDMIPCNKLYAYFYLDPEHGDKPQGARIQVCRSWAADSGNQKWGNVLLTSAGFEDMDGNQKINAIKTFQNMLGKPFDKARVLFIPTAANDDGSKKMAKLCRLELINMGILPENIIVYDIDGSMGIDEAMEHDVIYFTGGDTSYLLDRVKKIGFDTIIKKMVYSGKVYIGVSAGSLIATPNIGEPYDEKTSGLCLINAYLSVHSLKADARSDASSTYLPDR